MLESDEGILKALHEHLTLGEAGIAAFKAADDKGWAMVNKPFHESVERLLTEGLVERHPSVRRTRWYRISEKGVVYLSLMERDQAKEVDRPAWVNEAIQAYRRRDAGETSQEDSEKIWKLLCWEARESFKVLARQLATDGYTYIPEPGRTAESFIVAFFGVYNGVFRLYQYRTRGSITTWREIDYYPPEVSRPDPGFEFSPTPRELLPDIPL